MYKIGIIQHSSGAPAPTPPALVTFQFGIDWSTVYHYTISNIFGYTTQRVKRTPPGFVTFDVYYSLGVEDISDVFKLYIRQDDASFGPPPTFDITRSPLSNGGFNLVDPPVDPTLGYLPIITNFQDCYISFGVEAGPDFYTYFPNRDLVTPVVVTIASSNQVVDSFEIILDGRI